MARSARPAPRRSGVLRAGHRLAGAASIGVLVAAFLVSPVFCWGSGAEAPPVTPTAVAPAPHEPFQDVPPAPEPAVPPPVVVDAAAVLGAVDAAGAGAAAALRAVVLDPQGRTVLQTPEADRPVLSASLVKLLVVQQLLARAEPVDDRTRGRMERAVTASDDQAMNVLWSVHDGAALVRAAAAGFGLPGTSPPAEAGQWGEATTTAADVARLLGALVAVPGRPDAAALLGWMRAATPVAADGFDQRFGLLSGAGGGGVAAKQGWMCCVDRRRHLHSAGVLADGRVVVVLGEAPASTSWRGLRAAVDGATAALVAGTR